MRKLILTCALITSVSVLSFGQDANSKPATMRPAPPQRGPLPAPEKIAEIRATTYKQQLGLNDEQYKGIYNAELNYVQKDQEWRKTRNQDQNNTQQMPHGPNQQLMMAHDQQFKQILTADQYAKYDKMRPMPRPAPLPGAAPAPAPATR